MVLLKLPNNPRSAIIDGTPKYANTFLSVDVIFSTNASLMHKLLSCSVLVFCSVSWSLWLCCKTSISSILSSVCTPISLYVAWYGTELT